MSLQNERLPSAPKTADAANDDNNLNVDVVDDDDDVIVSSPAGLKHSDVWMTTSDDDDDDIDDFDDEKKKNNNNNKKEKELTKEDPTLSPRQRRNRRQSSTTAAMRYARINDQAELVLPAAMKQQQQQQQTEEITTGSARRQFHFPQATDGQSTSTLVESDSSKPENNEEEEDDDDENPQVAQFLANNSIDTLQRDLAEAETLFYKQMAIPTPEQLQKQEQAEYERRLKQQQQAIIADIDEYHDKDDPHHHNHHKIQVFNSLYYDNMEHEWNKKPFVLHRMITFLGTVKEERMDQTVQAVRRKIIANGAWDPQGLVLAKVGRLFGTKLLLSVSEDYASQRQRRQREWKLRRGRRRSSNNGDENDDDDEDESNDGDTTDDDDDDATLTNNLPLVHLTGTFLSKVYTGEYSKFSLWAEDAIKYVERRYKLSPKQVQKGRNSWFAFYPTVTPETLLPRSNNPRFKHPAMENNNSTDNDGGAVLEEITDKEITVVFFIKVKDGQEDEEDLPAAFL